MPNVGHCSSGEKPQERASASCSGASWQMIRSRHGMCLLAEWRILVAESAGLNAVVPSKRPKLIGKGATAGDGHIGSGHSQRLPMERLAARHRGWRAVPRSTVVTATDR